MNKANVPQLIAEFSKHNDSLLEAMRLFEVSNVEYERAMRALAPSPATTTVSTQGYEEMGRDAVVE